MQTEEATAMYDQNVLALKDKLEQHTRKEEWAKAAAIAGVLAEMGRQNSKKPSGQAPRSTLDKLIDPQDRMSQLEERIAKGQPDYIDSEHYEKLCSVA